MKERILASRYARALADVAQRSGELERVRSELAAFCQGTAQSRLFGEFVQSGRVSATEKTELMLRIARRSGFAEVTVRFLACLTRRRRLGLVGEVAREFSLEADRRLGIQRAEVTTAVALTDEQCEGLRAKLERVSAKRIRMTLRTDRSLLGGLQIRLGNVFFDGSVRGRLQRLRQRISHAGNAVHTA